MSQEIKKEAEQQIIDQGGIRWKCSNCDSDGVLFADTKIAKDVRKRLNKPIGECSIEFSDCYQHTG